MVKNAVGKVYWNWCLYRGVKIKRWLLSEWEDVIRILN